MRMTNQRYIIAIRKQSVAQVYVLFCEYMKKVELLYK